MQDKSSFRNRMKNIASISEANKDERPSPPTRSTLQKKVKDITEITRENNGRMTSKEVGDALKKLQDKYLSTKGGSRNRTKKTKGKRKMVGKTKKTKKWFQFF